MPKNKKLTIFDFMNSLTNDKQDRTQDPCFEKEYNPFMMNRWLSMHKHTFWPAYFADQVRGMSKKNHFYFLRELIDKKKVFIQYKKGKKSDKQSKIIMEYYNVGFEEAEEILNQLDNKQIKLIENSFGGKTKIRKSKKKKG